MQNTSGTTPDPLATTIATILDKYSFSEKQQVEQELIAAIQKCFPPTISTPAFHPPTASSFTPATSWIAGNISPLLAIAIILLTFALYGWILFGGEYLKERENVIFAVLGSLTTMSACITSYYFGSSIGATKHRDALLDNLAKNPSA